MIPSFNDCRPFNGLLSVFSLVPGLMLTEQLKTSSPFVNRQIRVQVLTARGSGVHISSKIRTQAERQRLETLGRLLKPDGYRLLLRTESRAAKGKEIQQDIHQLQTTLEGILKKAEEAVKRNTGPLLLYKAMTPTQAIVRDLMSVEVGMFPLTFMGASSRCRSEHFTSSFGIEFFC